MAHYELMSGMELGSAVGYHKFYLEYFPTTPSPYTILKGTETPNLLNKINVDRNFVLLMLYGFTTISTEHVNYSFPDTFILKYFVMPRTLQPVVGLFCNDLVLD
jgi:hypothetical protein